MSQRLSWLELGWIRKLRRDSYDDSHAVWISRVFLMKRVLTALALVPLVTGMVFFAPPFMIAVGLALTALLCLREFFGVVTAGGVRPLRFLRISGYVLTTMLIMVPGPDLLSVGFVLLALIVFLPLMWRHSMTGKAVAATLLGIVYIGGSFTLARELHLINPHWLFWVLFLNWIGDSAAYYVGRSIGRHKLAPRVSPNKTWEGAFASTVMATAMGVAYWSYFITGAMTNIYFVIVMTILVNIAGQVGDLAESFLKRSASLKDSGDILPGHGGILDRVDGVLFSVPILYWILNW